MITKRVADLFQFIEFLHSNTETFKAYDVVIGEIGVLRNEQRKLKHKENYKDKIRYDEINAEVVTKIDVIVRGVVQPIQAEVKKYNIYNLETLGGARLDEDIVSYLLALKKNVNVNDVPQILDSIKKYIEFRTKTNDAYFQSLFFSSLDETLQDLFVFFEGGTGSEFKAFEVFKKISTAECEQPTCGLKGIYEDGTLEAIFDKLVEKGWFIGEKNHFVAIFNGKELPQGWQPIEYIKKHGKKPNKAALAALVYFLYPKVKAGYVWSGFTVNKKTFEIDKNRESYTGIEKHELKGIELKLRE